jgi:hypothetical protein
LLMLRPIALLPVFAVFVGSLGLRLEEQPSLVLDGIPIYGGVEKIPEPTLRATIGLDRSLLTSPASKIYLIDVVSRTARFMFTIRRATHGGKTTKYINASPANGAFKSVWSAL